MDGGSSENVILWTKCFLRFYHLNWVLVNQIWPTSSHHQTIHAADVFCADQSINFISAAVHGQYEGIFAPDFASCSIPEEPPNQHHDHDCRIGFTYSLYYEENLDGNKLFHLVFNNRQEHGGCPAGDLG